MCQWENQELAKQFCPATAFGIRWALTRRDICRRTSFGARLPRKCGPSCFCVHVYSYPCQCLFVPLRLRTRICLYICMSVYACVHLRAFACASEHGCIHVCLYACVYVRVCVCLPVYVCVCVIVGICVGMHACMCVCVRAHVCLRVVRA